MRHCFFIVFAFIVATSCNNNSHQFQHKTPRVIICKDLCQSEDSTAVWRTAEYVLDTVYYDTTSVERRASSTVLPTERYNVTQNNDRVDLNDFFDDSETDWNYTELSEDEWRYLDSLGVTWNEEKGYYIIQK